MPLPTVFFISSPSPPKEITTTGFLFLKKFIASPEISKKKKRDPKRIVFFNVPRFFCGF